MSSLDEPNPVPYGDIDYGRVFFTFTEHTDQKIAHSLIFQALLYALKERGVLLRDGRADSSSGPGLRRGPNRL